MNLASSVPSPSASAIDWTSQGPAPTSSLWQSHTAVALSGCRLETCGKAPRLSGTSWRRPWACRSLTYFLTHSKNYDGDGLPISQGPYVEAVCCENCHRVGR